MILEINDDERDDIYYSLGLRLGFIETGASMRAIDAKNCGKPELIRVLDRDQRQVQNRVEDLMMRVLQCRK